MFRSGYTKAVAVVALLLLAGLLGCGSGGPRKYPVRGVIRHKGEPVPLGTVMFVPASGPASAPAGIGPDGSYELQAVAGEHKVVVVAVEEPTGLRQDPTIEGGIDYSQAKPGRLLVPEKYGDHRTSDASVQVEAKENQIDIELP